MAMLYSRQGIYLRIDYQILSVPSPKVE